MILSCFNTDKSFWMDVLAIVNLPDFYLYRTKCNLKSQLDILSIIGLVELIKRQSHEGGQDRGDNRSLNSVCV